MPDMWMDVDTVIASAFVNRAALIDDSDFKAREEGVTYDQAGMDLLWNFTTTAGVSTQTAVTPTTGGGDYDWTNLGNGMYAIGIVDTGGASIDNDTEGVGFFSGFATGILPWSGPTIGFRAAALNNAYVDGATAPAVAGDAMTLAADAIKAVSYDESTAFPLKADDSAATQVARVGADGDTLETLSDQIDGTAVPGDAMNLAADAIKAVSYDESTAFPLKADDSAATQVARVGADGDTLETLSDQIDGVAVPGDAMNLAADAIKAVSFDESTAFPVKADDSGATQIARVGADGDTLETLSDEIALQATLAINTEARMAELDGANLPADVDAILADTGEIGTAGAGLTDLGGMATAMKAEVNAEVLDVMNVDTFAEPGQGAPGATISIFGKIGYLYKQWRNKLDNDGSTMQLYNDAGAVVDQKRDVTDAAGTSTKAEVESGP